MSITVDSFFPITGPCLTNVNGNGGTCAGGTRRFMTWVHTPVANPSAIVVMLAWQDGATDKEKDAEVTYGDVHLLLRSQLARNHTGTRDGAVSVYVLTSEQGIPTGPQRVRVNYKDDSGPRVAISFALVCAAGKWISLAVSGKHEGPTSSPSVTMSPGDLVDTFVLAGLYYGKSSPNLADATPNAGYTRVDAALPSDVSTQTAVVDFIKATGMSGGGDVTPGWALNTSGDSVGMVAAAFTEITPGAEFTQGRIPFIVAKTADGGFGNILLPAVVQAGGLIQPGDTAVIFARNGNSSTQPVLTPGFTDFAHATDGQGRAWRVAYRTLTDGDYDTGPWTNADTISVVVYRGASPVQGTFAGAYAAADGNGVSYTYPSLNRAVTSRRGWVLSFLAYGSGGTTSFDKPRRDRRKDTVGFSSELNDDFVALSHTPLPVTTLASDVAGMTGAGGHWTSISLEVFSTYQIIGTPGPWVWQITDGTLPDGLSLDTNTGKVAGTPATPGTFRFRYLVKNNFQVIPEQSCTVVVTPEKKRRKTRDMMVLGTDTGSIMLPDAIEDFTSTLSVEEGVVCAVRGRAYAPNGTDGEVVFRRLYVTGYHRAAIGLWIVPVIDGRPVHDLRTWFHKPAPASGTEERFSVLVPLTREHPDFPGMLYGLRGSVAEIYIETTDPADRVHIEAAAWAHEPINNARIRTPGEADFGS